MRLKIIYYLIVSLLLIAILLGIKNILLPF